MQINNSDIQKLYISLKEKNLRIESQLRMLINKIKSGDRITKQMLKSAEESLTIQDNSGYEDFIVNDFGWTKLS